MKKLGSKQFERKTYKVIELDGEWKRFLGAMMHGARLLVYGISGFGKTECCLQLAQELAKHGRGMWVSYEQAHGMDLQGAYHRNKTGEWYGGMVWANPWSDLPSEFKEPLFINGKKASVVFQDLVHEMAKNKSPQFWFIDSIQESTFTYDEWQYLSTRFTNKTLIVISLSDDGKRPKGSVAVRIGANAQYRIRVHQGIAFNEKNRFPGDGERIVNEKMARELNPLYFEKNGPTPVKKERKSKKVAK
jgi:hypothetical protein